MRRVRHPRARRGQSRARLIVPVAGAGILVACLGALLLSPAETHTVSHVTRTIREIALAGNAPDAPPGAGTLGPWAIAAETADPVSGEFTNFRLTSGVTLVAARRSRLLVDHVSDSFSFELWDVVFTRAPAADDDEADGGVLRAMDHFVLGPAFYGVDIVPDAPSDAPEPASIADAG